MKIAQETSLLFTGDSITDCGRSRPIGGINTGLGEGYVAFVNSLFTAWYPQYRIKVLNTGISGDRVIDLAARWQTDILNWAPDWLSVMIGINDVWRQFDNMLDPDQVSIERYEQTYRKLLEQTRPKLKGLVLMTPYFLESNLSDPMRKLMDMYGGVVKRLASAFDAIFVDVQAAFDFHLTHQPTQTLCNDRVHPNKTGHLIIAVSFLTAIGFDWNLAGKVAGGSNNL